MADQQGTQQVWRGSSGRTATSFFIVPDADLHEQGVFPSRFKSDHKTTFTIYKISSGLSIHQRAGFGASAAKRPTRKPEVAGPRMLIQRIVQKTR